jgi:hypothetical protein
LKVKLALGNTRPCQILGAVDDGIWACRWRDIFVRLRGKRLLGIQIMFDDRENSRAFRLLNLGKLSEGPCVYDQEIGSQASNRLG